MLERLSPAKRNLALGILALLVTWFAWSVRSVLNPLLLGYLLAFIVHPLVHKLEQRGWGRRRAVNLIFIVTGVLFLVVSVGVFAQGRSLAIRLARSDVWSQAEARVEKAIMQATSLMHGAEESAPETPPETAPAGSGADPALPADPTLLADPSTKPVDDVKFTELVREFWDELGREQAAEAGQAALRGAGGAWSLLRKWFGSLLGFGALLVLLPLYSYFLLFELERIHGFVRRYIPVRERERVSRIGRKIGEVLESFFRGRLLICFLKGAFLTIGLWISGIDYALLLGMGSGFLALVPFVGPFFGFLFAILVGLLDPQLSVLGLLLRTSIVFGLAELVEGYVLVPKVLGDSLGLHPVVVLASVMVGGAALGMFGFLIALPLTASLVILGRELVLPALGAWADERGEA